MGIPFTAIAIRKLVPGPSPYETFLTKIPFAYAGAVIGTCVFIYSFYSLIVESIKEA